MRKRILSVILAASLLLALTPNTAMAAKMDGDSLQIQETTEKEETADNSSYMEGLGTEASPYRIKNAEQFRIFADMVNGISGAPNTGLCAVLTSDIDLSGICGADIGLWMPIGTDANPYTGIFDGGSYAITGLYYHKSNSSYAGLFGHNAGIIKNLEVVGADVAAGSYTGGICGYNNGTIAGCYNAAPVKGARYTGGICGYNDGAGTVNICYNTGSVSGSKYVGGICGYNKNMTGDCYNMGTVNGDSTSIGGICGYNKASVSNCFNTGTISGNGKKYIGSICGYNSSESSFLNCYYLITGEEKGNYGVGMTQEQFASGEVCWLLNEGKSENVVWHQTCGAGFPAFGGKVVYQVQRQKTGGRADEMSVAYSNEKEKKQAASNDASAEEKDSDNNSDRNTDGHIYQEPEWKWKEYKSANAVFTCQDCGENLVLKASISKKTTEATCAKEGETVYTASVDKDGETYKDKKTVKSEKLAHQTLKQISKEDATCTEPGINLACWTCPACRKYFEDQAGTKELSRGTVEIPAKGHQYSGPSWSWTPNYSASATFTCTVCLHTEEKKGTVTSKTNATCEKPGDTIYTAVVKFNGTTYKEDKTVNGEPIPHSYGTPKWSWTADYTTAKATFTCKKCSNPMTKEVTSTSEKITDSTCKTAGKIKHIAIVTLDGKEYSDVKNESLPLGNHNFGAPVWTWAKDNKSATAQFTCGTCKKRVTEEAAVTKVVPDDLTCGAVGEVKYMASVTFENMPYSVEKTEKIQLEHKPEQVKKVPATCESDGNEEYWKCSVCGNEFYDAAGQKPITGSKPIIPATGHKFELVPDTTNIYKCTVCEKKFKITEETDGTTRMSSVDEDTVVTQDETENNDGADYSDEEKQDEAEQTQGDSWLQDADEQDTPTEQDEESMPNEQSEEDGHNEDENNGGVSDVLDSAERYGMIYPEGEDANPVTTDAWGQSTVNLRAKSTRNGAAQTVQEQQQQGHPLWISAAVLVILAGVVLFFILRKKGNR
ncbi:MAG: hypothetical protein K2M70_02540 [Lachnospiraceae bacterium]|nr:hypothetical protein [Lachnospiraceae bacterium]